MKNIKDIWMKYQMEKALQLIELDSEDQNELRLKELEKQMKSTMLSVDSTYDSDLANTKPNA